MPNNLIWISGNPSDKYEMVFIVGPRMRYLDNGELQEQIRKSRMKVCIIGDGRNFLSENLLRSVLCGKIDGNTSIHIRAHGAAARLGKKHYGSHGIHIYQENRNYDTLSFLSDLKKIFDEDLLNEGKTMMVDIWSCNCGVVRQCGNLEGMIVTLHGGQKYAKLAGLTIAGMIRAIDTRKQYPTDYPYLNFIDSVIHSPETITFIEKNKHFIAKSPKYPLSVYRELERYIFTNLVEYSKYCRDQLGLNIGDDITIEEKIFSTQISSLILRRYNELALIMRSFREGSERYIRMSADVGVDINAVLYGSSSLRLAVDSGNKNIVKVLLDNGANINQEDRDGYTPLFLACLKGSVEIVRVLLSNEFRRNLDINKTLKNGATSLHIACRVGSEEIVSMLVARNFLGYHSANIDQQMLNGSTPLYIACEEGNDNIVRNLLSRGADIEKGLYDQITPLMIAAHKNQEEVVKILLEKITDVSIITRRVDGDKVEEFMKNNINIRNSFDQQFSGLYNSNAEDMAATSIIKDLIREKVKVLEEEGIKVREETIRLLPSQNSRGSGI